VRRLGMHSAGGVSGVHRVGGKMKFGVNHEATKCTQEKT
jgi:hypothetical protein